MVSLYRDWRRAFHRGIHRARATAARASSEGRLFGKVFFFSHPERELRESKDSDLLGERCAILET